MPRKNIAPSTSTAGNQTASESQPKKSKSQNKPPAQKVQHVQVGLSTGNHCQHCNDDVYFDVHSGIEYTVCLYHLCSPTVTRPAKNKHKPSVIPPRKLHATSNQASCLTVCALEECCNPRHVDTAGTVQECCGYTHAMELIRRKIIEGKILFPLTNLISLFSFKVFVGGGNIFFLLFFLNLLIKSEHFNRGT